MRGLPRAGGGADAGGRWPVTVGGWREVSDRWPVTGDRLAPPADPVEADRPRRPVPARPGPETLCPVLSPFSARIHGPFRIQGGKQ